MVVNNGWWLFCSKRKNFMIWVSHEARMSGKSNKKFINRGSKRIGPPSPEQQIKTETHRE